MNQNIAHFIYDQTEYNSNIAKYYSNLNEPFSILMYF